MFLTTRHFHCNIQINHRGKVRHFCCFSSLFVTPKYIQTFRDSSIISPVPQYSFPPLFLVPSGARQLITCGRVEPGNRDAPDGSFVVAWRFYSNRLDSLYNRNTVWTFSTPLVIFQYLSCSFGCERESFILFRAMLFLAHPDATWRIGWNQFS